MSEQDQRPIGGGAGDGQRRPEETDFTGLTGESAPVEETAAVEGERSPARAASVQLRDARESHAALMDPANQSLAEALKITFRLLMLGMVVLVVFFLFSGVTRVNEGQRGIALRFGAVTSPSVEPGLRLAAPFPIGELERVSVSQVQLDLGREFVAGLRNNDPTTPVDRWETLQQFNPARHNYHLTADLNIAHSQWTATYVREDHVAFAENIDRTAEERIVRAALERGVVHAMATTPIDDLLKASAGDSNSVAQRARRIAQEQLDRIDSGIRVQTLSLRTRVPPKAVLNDFNAVQTATSQAAQAVEEARQYRNSMLNSTAGGAASQLIEQINEYERQLALGDDAAAEAVLAQINAMIDGRGADGRPTALVSGEVTEIINNAETDRTRVVQRSQADLSTYQAALAGYRANPELLIARTWGTALQDLMAQPWVEKMFVPEGSDGVVVVNRDPRIDRERVRQQQREEVEDAFTQRIRTLLQNDGVERGVPQRERDRNAQGGRGR